MHVALVNALYPTPLEPKIFGGAEMVVRQLAEGLVARGDRVTVVRMALDGRRRTEEANGVRVEFVPVRNLFAPFGARHHALAHLAWHAIDDRCFAHPEVAAVLDAARPDVMNTHTLNGLNTHVWQLARDRGIPVAHSLHDYYLICPRCSRFKDGHVCATTCGSCAVLTGGRRRRSALVDAVVSVSRRTLDLHLQEGLFGTASRHVIHNVPNPALHPEPMEAIGRPLRIGYLGRFSEEKGVRLLADAVGRLPAGTVRLVLAGNVTNEQRAALAVLAPGAELHFLGFVAPADFYPQIDVAAVPSLWEEPGALVLLDALAAGRPVVATALGGLPEMYEDGVTGWTAPPEAEGLAAVLRRLVAAPDLILAAHRVLREKPRRAMADVVDAYRDIYRTLTPAS
ncbi:glycosyltransferase family 4 protein [Xanthobacter sp. V3C-3]|uniref:glycosyltransferase family 4 protein n=1 Tax=Xanthobacter lutulentifluminis TaxID=3119935 RepID=UPI00372A5E6F